MFPSLALRHIPTAHPSQHVVIMGGGFGGLYATKALGHLPVQVTLLDRRNFHLFQPLLYQVATGGLSPGDIASPLRSVLHRYSNVRVLLAEAIDLDADRRRVILSDGEVPYDTLIVATGASHHYFGNDEWGPMAPGLKTVENALDIRQRIFLAFEAAEREPDPQKRQAWLTFFIVGGGPTGVELAGALAELAHSTLSKDFRQIDPAEAEILLLEGVERILPSYPPELSSKAEAALDLLGVTVRTRTRVTRIEDGIVTFRSGDRTQQVQAHTILWAAGVQASRMGQVLAKQTGVPLDRAGRVMVERDLTLPGYPNIFVIGDLANFSHQDGKPLPGVAQVAMQQGRYAAELIKRRLAGKRLPPFRYRDKGSLAVIGRNSAVADLGFVRFDGMLAWLIWAGLHIRGLVEFDNKALVLLQWAWHYVTHNVGARLITGKDPLPLVKSHAEERGSTSVDHHS